MLVGAELRDQLCGALFRDAEFARHANSTFPAGLARLPCSYRCALLAFRWDPCWMGTKLKVAADMATCLQYDDRPLARKCNGPTCTACAHITCLRLLCLTGLADKLVGTASGTATAGVALEHGRDIVNVLAVDQLADSLEVAVAAADEIHVLDGVAVEIDVDLSRAYALGSIGVHIRFLSLGW